MSKTILTLFCVCAIVFAGCESGKPAQDAVNDLPQDTILSKPLVETPLAGTMNIDTTSAKIAGADTEPKRIPLTVIIQNLKSPDAPIEMSIYGPDNKFPDGNGGLKKLRFKPSKGKAVARINDLSYGEFALALYQDLNNDGQIDKNAIGIPTEPYAFSNNFKPTVKAPRFDDCKFAYSAEANTVSINLLRK
jgi:uncharacterized protein (DUF2141 family)